MKTTPLPLAARAPFVHVVRWTADDDQWIPQHYFQRPPHRFEVRVLRGGKAPTKQALMDQCAAAFQFAEFFGSNWHALGELLMYLDEWMAADGYVTVYDRPEHLLASEPAAELGWLLVTAHEVGTWWSAPIDDNGQFNRPARPFHTVFRPRPDVFDEFVARCRSALVAIERDDIPRHIDGVR